MNDANPNPHEAGIKPRHHPQMTPSLYEGIYHSISINKPSAEVYDFCRNKANLERVLSDLPEKTENFLDLKLEGGTSLSDGRARVEWRNTEISDVQGSLTFILSPAPAGKGTVVVANAVFDDYTMKNEGPSDLINLFLKRIKSLAETGQLATIKGQPNGKDEHELQKHGVLNH